MADRSGNFEGTRYELHGETAAPPVALIHGLGLTRGIWASYVRPLAMNFRVLTYDLLGHGESDLPAVTPNLSTYSEQLNSIAAHLELGPLSAVGFSLGGMINRRLVMDHPDSVSSLVILNSPHGRSPEAQSAVERRALDSVDSGPGANLAETLERWFTPDFLRTHPDVVSQVTEWVVSNDAKAYADCRFVLANGVVELVRPDPPIQTPTLVMTCEHDSGSTPEFARAIASEIPDAELIIIDDLQHLGLLERPDLFLSHIERFLQAHIAVG